ncbi:MAG: F0F1 ATP synthase subunit B [Chloroflexi bacterium]|nr:F0F1 ATP synthase subunit B [Chloroflexota bacterium]
MLIDWFTVIAQIINFLILVLLLRRFLYRPILNAMAERERKIADRLAAAEAQRVAATAEIEAYRQKNSAFAQEREQMVREAEATAVARKQAWLEQARTEVNETRTRWQKALAEEKESFLQTMRQQVGQQTYHVIRRALTDLADAGLEARIVDVFLARLAALPPDDAQTIYEALQGDMAVLTLNSSFEIDNAQRQALRQALFAQFGPGQAIRFATTPDLICGLELVAPGHKVAWSLSSYLDELEETLGDVLAHIPAASETAAAETAEAPTHAW